MIGDIYVQLRDSKISAGKHPILNTKIGVKNIYTINT